MVESYALHAVSPLDGRYAERTAPLGPYVSEAALMRARVRVEIEYLIALADCPAIALGLDENHRDQLRSCYREFHDDDAILIKEIEREGHGPYAATNHDVKAVEYFIRLKAPDDRDIAPWIHFGLTSEDVNNLAYRLCIRQAVREVLLPALETIRDRLTEMAREYRSLPMLARTHGQPATPTTFGKEMAVYGARLGRAIARIDRAVDGMRGKLAGASGTYAAHHVAYPDVDWPAFARSFVADLGFDHESVTTQINPCDDLAELFDAIRGANGVLIDLDRDAWLYVSDRYLGQAATAGETGSSTMPHKVNPIDFENSEGNLEKASADLSFLAETLQNSRLQRDLSDSTVKRNIGVAFAHCLIGYTKADDGLTTVVPNEAVMREDLEANPAVIGEAIQTVLRREGFTDAYERVKDRTRDQEVTIETFRDLIEDLDIDEATREQLAALTPATYVGIAAELADSVAED